MATATTSLNMVAASQAAAEKIVEEIRRLGRGARRGELRKNA